VMYLMYQPIYTSFLPVFCARHAAAAAGADATELWQGIAVAGRIMAIAVLPVAALLFACPGLVIFAWTGDAALADGGSGVLRWVIVGAAVNAFLFIPFALQQAAGDLRPWGWRIALALAAYIPLALAAIHRWGMQGAAAAWCAGSVLLAGWLAHTTALALGPAPGGRGGLLAVLAQPVLRTLLACGLVAAAAAIVPAPSDRIASALLALGLLGLCALVALRSQAEVWSVCLRALARPTGVPAP
jgi:O-antigen/teichoic acid export membrane protein